MKKIIIFSVFSILLMLNGCGNKEPHVEAASETDGVIVKMNIPDDVLKSDSEIKSKIKIDLQSIYFNFDKFNIRENMQDILSANYVVINSNNLNVRLEGNCDEWGSDEYNFALGLKRVNTVKKALVAEGLNKNNISMVSFGENNPICNDKTIECWNKNRRADLKY